MAAGEREQPADQIDDGALARAIRSDQAEDLALRDGEIDVVDRAHAAEMLGQTLELKHRHVPCLREEPPERGNRTGIDQPARPHIHGEHDQPAEQKIAPVTHETQAFDQEALDEDDREQRAEHVGKPAEDRIGDREGREHHAELHMLDVGGVMREQPAADARR